jgi:hypothetical protein
MTVYFCVRKHDRSGWATSHDVEYFSNLGCNVLHTCTLKYKYLHTVVHSTVLKNHPTGRVTVVVVNVELYLTGRL